MRSAATCLSIFLVLTLGATGRTEDRAEPPPSEPGADRSDAESKAAEAGTARGTDPEVKELRIYIPPNRGAKKVRVGASTRGARLTLPVIHALAPDDPVGLTTQAQPVLAWYLSEEVDSRIEIEIALIDDSSVEPVLELTVEPPVAPGIQTLRLGDHGLSLEKGQVYRWFVALVPDPEQRSNDVITSGAIERVDRDPALERELASVDASEAYRVLARRGIWYDAFAAVSERIRANPQDPEPRVARAQLLEEVGLESAAALDRASLGG